MVKSIVLSFFFLIFLTKSIYSQEKIVFIDLNFIFNNSNAGKDLNLQIEKQSKELKIQINESKINIENKGDIQKVVFTIIPPKNQSEGLITPIINIDGEYYTDELIEIDYEHIKFKNVLMKRVSKVVRIDIDKRGNNIG